MAKVQIKILSNKSLNFETFVKSAHDGSEVEILITKFDFDKKLLTTLFEELDSS